MRPLPVLMLVLAAALAGCDRGGAGRDSLRDDVLKSDPKFSEVLRKHDEVASRIALLNQELALKRSQVERQITQLRNELDAVTAQVKGKIEQTKSQLRPEFDRVAAALSAAVTELKVKRTQRASLGRSISRTKKSLAAKSGWTGDERSKFNHDLDDLMKEAERLDREITVLVKHIELLKHKRELLKL